MPDASDVMANEKATGPASAALAYGRGERRFGPVNWLGLRTLLMKEVRRFLKVAFQTIFAPVISTILFLVVFMQAFGDARAPIAGVPYIEFLAPGLIMMAILSNAFANSSSSLVIGKVQGSIVDVLMPPLSPAELTVAFVVGAAARGLLVGLVAGLTSAFFMAFSSSPMRLVDVGAGLVFSIGGAVMFGMLGVLAGVWAEKFDQLAAVQNFLITPLTFLSGTFYAIGSLSEPFRTIAHLNPVFYLIDGFRYAFTGEAETNLFAGAAVTFAICGVLGAACYFLFRSGYRLKS